MKVWREGRASEFVGVANDLYRRKNLNVRHPKVKKKREWNNNGDLWLLFLPKANARLQEGFRVNRVSIFVVNHPFIPHFIISSPLLFLPAWRSTIHSRSDSSLVLRNEMPLIILEPHFPFLIACFILFNFYLYFPFALQGKESDALHRLLTGKTNGTNGVHFHVTIQLVFSRYTLLKLQVRVSAFYV